MLSVYTRFNIFNLFNIYGTIMSTINTSNKTDEDQVVTLRIRKDVVKLIDKERAKFSAPRSTWITQSIVERLEKLVYEVN